MSDLIDTALLQIKTSAFTFIILAGVILILIELFRPSKEKIAGIKGKFGEQIVSFFLKHGLNQNIYMVMNDVIIPDDAGGTTQIDHIVISPYGIFVIETKNMSGWIFGNEKAAYWTQVVFKSKKQFQNPFRQNYKHIKCLSDITGVPEKGFFPIIAFIGDCSVRTELPESFVISPAGVLRQIKKHTEAIFDPNDLVLVHERILGWDSSGTSADRKAHVNYVREMIKEKKSGRRGTGSAAGFGRRTYGNADGEFCLASHAVCEPDCAGDYDVSEPVCPKCGSSMVLRTAKSGKNAGKQFWGCSRFPNCRGIIKIKD